MIVAQHVKCWVRIRARETSRAKGRLKALQYKRLVMGLWAHLSGMKRGEG
jgi:hypothetical protein